MTPSDESSEFHLAKPVEISPAARGVIELPPPKAEGETNVVAADRQFSLRELFGLTTFAAVLFGGFQWLPPAWMALGLGIAACVSLALSSVLQIRRPSLILAWWILLFTYIGACAIAIRGMHSPLIPSAALQHPPEAQQKDATACFRDPTQLV